jgi:hypothetical protein
MTRSVINIWKEEYIEIEIENEIEIFEIFFYFFLRFFDLND